MREEFATEADRRRAVQAALAESVGPQMIADGARGREQALWVRTVSRVLGRVRSVHHRGW
jgi:hypothetical protein